MFEVDTSACRVVMPLQTTLCYHCFERRTAVCVGRYVMSSKRFFYSMDVLAGACSSFQREAFPGPSLRALGRFFTNTSLFQNSRATD